MKSRLDRLPPHVNGHLQMVVESPRGSNVKLVYDPDIRAFRCRRSLPIGLAYPWDWGFVPGTEAPDGDPVDAILLWDGCSHPGLVIACRAVAVLELEQKAPDGSRPRRQRNDRLIVVPEDDARTESLHGLRSLPKSLREEIERFFLNTVFFENKGAKVLGWRNGKAARKLVRSSKH